MVYLRLIVFVHAMALASSLLTDASVDDTQNMLESWGLDEFFGSEVKDVGHIFSCSINAHKTQQFTSSMFLFCTCPVP